MVKLLGITSFGIVLYFQYYTFVILSEKLESFTIQQRNYLVLVGKIVGRVTFFCVVPFSTRRFLNFLISSVLLVLSSTILWASYFFSGDAMNTVGVVFAGRHFHIS